MPGIKAIPVPAEEEAPETTAEPAEEKKETESDSEGTEESEVSTESSEEQETVQSEEPKQLDTDDGIATDVAKIESKLNKNIKTIAKQIAKVTKETTKNLSKEDLFFRANDLDSYSQVAFYTAKEIYNNTNMWYHLKETELIVIVHGKHYILRLYRYVKGLS